mmetsp:Transcript_34677/g.51382  ORF Transcript_34677/g.51382 Transcript_34677/m.51382 type:complete len:215 (-) Transcript_34677:46-690(-)
MRNILYECEHERPKFVLQRKLCRPSSRTSFYGLRQTASSASIHLLASSTLSLLRAFASFPSAFSLALALAFGLFSLLFSVARLPSLLLVCCLCSLAFFFGSVHWCRLSLGLRRSFTGARDAARLPRPLAQPLLLFFRHVVVSIDREIFFVVHVDAVLLCSMFSFLIPAPDLDSLDDLCRLFGLLGGLLRCLIVLCSWCATVTVASLPLAARSCR